MKKIRLFVFVTLLIALVGNLLFLSGCKNQKTTSEQGDNNYVIKYWCELPASMASKFKNLGETDWAKETESLTGVKVEYIHPSAGQESAQFNLMLASKDLPDVIETNLYGMYYTNGINGALEDGMIIDLKSLIEKYAPDLKGYIEKYPAVQQGVTAPGGKIHSIPFIGADNFNTFGGLVLRKDFLDKAKLPLPETIDDWEKVLYAFKEQGVKYPFIARQNAGLIKYPQPFATAFGVIMDFYLDDNDKVLFGLSDGDLKGYITTLTKWQNAGLIDAEWFVQNDQVMKTKILNNEAGVFFGFLGGEMGNLINTAKNAGNKEFVLSGAKYPTINKGDTQKYTNVSSSRFRDTTANITSACKNPELVIKWINKAYFSKEGDIISNYGVKDKTYTVKDGKYIYTDFVTKNPEGASMAEVLSKYTRANVPRIGINQDGYFEQYYSNPSVREAAIMYSKTDSGKHMLPKLLTLSKSEQEEFDKIYGPLCAYVDEECTKIVTGVKPISEIDKVVEKIKQMGAEKLKSMKQKAYDQMK